MSNYGNLVGTPSMDNHVAEMATSIMQSDQDELPIRDKLLKDTHKHRQKAQKYSPPIARQSRPSTGGRSNRRSPLEKVIEDQPIFMGTQNLNAADKAIVQNYANR